MINHSADYCYYCGGRITNELILVPDGYGTGYLVFDSFKCLAAYANKYDLSEMPSVPCEKVDRLISEVKRKPNWAIRTYGIKVIDELIRKGKI